MKLYIDKRENLLGIDDKTPRFSWKLLSEKRGERQTAYRIGIASTKSNAKAEIFDIWDSGKVISCENFALLRKDVILTPKTEYFWTLTYWNEEDEKTTSKVATFETGLFGDFGTSNKWVEAVGSTEENKLAASLFRKQFTLTQPLSKLAKARLYATAAGNHIMYINGKRAGDDYMAPGKSMYTEILYYQTYDVTDKILNGDNTIGAEVGHGWYNAGAVLSVYGTNVGLKAKLVITYKDGTEQVVDTDDTWLGTKEGRTTTNKYYIGQHVDGRKIIDGWCEIIMSLISG